MRVRDLFVDSPHSVGARMRARRWTLLVRTFPDFRDYDVLDLGGEVEFWVRAPIRPRHVTIVNMAQPPAGTPSWVNAVVGDACAFDGGRRYDLVVSNSLIEHVGGYARRSDLAGVVRAAAPRHWVQTPYRYFPVEPHWLCPGMQFLPLRARVVVARYWPLAHSRPEDRAAALSSVLWTELVSRTEMTHLFPDSRVFFERMLGLPKSLLAVRNDGQKG
jgi:hypothetical protein